MIDDRILVSFGLDQSYAPHLGATIASMVAWTKAPLEFLVLHTGVTAATQAKIEACAPRAPFRWVGVDDSRLLSLRGRAHFENPAIFFRLALPIVAPVEARRVVYLDSDVILAADIRRLFSADLDGLPIGAIYDAGVDAVPFAARWGLEREPGGYFNSGVLVIDLRHPETAPLFAGALAFVEAQRGELGFPDQDALNYVFWKRWKKLDPAWNAQRNMVMPGMPNYVPEPFDLGARPAIVHFTTEHKPWLRDTYNPYAWLYWYYLSKTPFGRAVARENRIGAREKGRLLLRFLRRWPLLASAAGA
ncbi:MAG: glycosyltransferase family 8 protein [Hyphomicrobiaceae bacterium]